MAGHVVELDLHRVALARLQRLGVFVAGAAVQMREVGHRVAQARDAAVGPDAVKPHGHVCHRLVHAELQREHWGAHQVKAGFEGVGVKGERARVVLALVARKLGAHPDDAVFAAVGARVLGRADGLLACARGLGRQACTIEVVALNRVAVAGPHLVAHPAPGDVADARARGLQVHHIGAKRGVVFHAGGRVFEVAVPPAQRFLQKADARLGHGKVRVFVRPGANNAFDRRLDAAHQTRHGVGVGVVPAAHGQHGGFDGANVFAHRAAFPIGVAVRVLQPVDGQQGLGLQAL